MSAVLIVDDSPADRALFRTILIRGGFTVHELPRGAQAVERARETRPHVIVLDVNLPDTDGFAVCRALRADPFCGGIPVLMLTVQGQEEDVAAGLEAGADDYLVKDSPSSLILARVKRLARYRQMATISVLNEQLAQVGRLMAGIVHEIRGPLAVIRGNAELMRMNLGENDATERWIEPIIRNSQLLQVRLEHLMATVRTGPPRLVPIEVPPFVQESADLFMKGADPRGGRITVEIRIPDTLPPVLADAGRMIQVMLNLYSNAREAILASNPNGTITTRAETSRRDDREWVKIEIVDDGPGVPEVHLDRIFEPFYTTKEGGSGYGLYLASEILREHGGRLTACNLDPGGACFTLWLPVAPPID